MQAVKPHTAHKRGGAEMKVETAKTDGMSKGGNVGAGGSNGGIFGKLKRGGAEIKVETARTDGVCKS